MPDIDLFPSKEQAEIERQREERFESIKNLIFCGQCKYSGPDNDGDRKSEYARCSKVKRITHDFYSYTISNSYCKETNANNQCTKFEKKEEVVVVPPSGPEIKKKGFFRSN